MAEPKPRGINPRTPERRNSEEENPFVISNPSHKLLCRVLSTFPITPYGMFVNLENCSEEALPLSSEEYDEGLKIEIKNEIPRIDIGYLSTKGNVFEERVQTISKTLERARFPKVHFTVTEFNKYVTTNPNLKEALKEDDGFKAFGSIIVPQLAKSGYNFSRIFVAFTEGYTPPGDYYGVWAQDIPTAYRSTLGFDGKDLVLNPGSRGFLPIRNDRTVLSGEKVEKLENWFKELKQQEQSSSTGSSVK